MFSIVHNLDRAGQVSRNIAPMQYSECDNLDVQIQKLLTGTTTAKVVRDNVSAYLVSLCRGTNSDST